MTSHEQELITKKCIPYSGYNLRGAISANHQIFHLEVIFAIIKFANHSMVFRGKINLRAYRLSIFRLYAPAVTLVLAMESEVDLFHIKEVWSSVIGEVNRELLVCHRDTRNRHEPCTVATCM